MQPPLEVPALTISSLMVRRSPTFCLTVDDLVLPVGKTLCLTGANGSGKTTLLETLVGIITPNRGTIRIGGELQDGKNPRSKRLLGYVPDDDGWIIPELTGMEYFRLLVSLLRKSEQPTTIARMRHLITTLSFTSFNQQAGSLSHGNRKKLQLIAALMHQPHFLVIDELRNGLDPLAIKVAEDLLKQEVARGTGIIAATHDLWWAERFSDRTVMVADGKILVDEETSPIVHKYGSLEARFFQLYAEATHE